MTTQIVPFSFNGAEVRTLLIEGTPWFVVADAARILGYRDAGNASRLLRPQHQGYSDVSTPSGSQKMLITNEGGLNRLLMRSNTEQAEAVQDWFTDVVLPAIRKTGTYSNAPALTNDQIVQQAFTILVAKSAALESKVAELEPVAAESMTYRQSAGLRTIQDLANDLRTHALSNLDGVKVIQSDVYEQAGRLGLIIRGDTLRNNQPTAQAINAGWVKPARTPIEHNDGTTSTKTYTRLTPKGGARLWDGCLTYIAEHGTLTIQKAVAA
jgi:prophage antirepressor-like protein